MKDGQPEPAEIDRRAEPDRSPRLSDDRLYRALAATPRRRLLYILLVEEKSTIDEIATVLAGWDATETGTITTPADREQIIVALEHIHLPRLSETGLVTYDRESGAVELERLDDAVIDLICQSVESEHPPRS
ncbi:MAG: hypothetical protein V5A55_15035 [Halovenus sp.]